MDNFGSPDNPTSSNYTSFSHDASTFPATTTVTSGLINDNDLQGNHIVPTHTTIAGMVLFYSLIFGNVLNDTRCNLNDTQETKQKKDEERKRDHKNAHFRHQV